MGIIQRQSIKQSLVNYIGVGIAAFSMIFIYPQDPEIYGFARFVIDTGYLFAPFILIGFGGVTIRFYPEFRDESKGHRGFLFFIVAAVFVGSIVFILFSLLFKAQFYWLFSDKESIYQEYLPYLIPLAMLIAYVQLFYNYSSNFKRIAVPALFQNLIKLSLPILILLFIWEAIEEQAIVNGIIATFACSVLGIIIYIKILGQLKLKPDFSLLNPTRLKAIRNYAMFNFFSNMGSVLAFRIDIFMIALLMDFENTGIFAISAFIANTIAIPTNAVNQIAGPIVTEAIKNNEFAKVKKLYQDSSINLLIIGLLLFVCIVVSIEDLFSIMPKSQNLVGGAIIVILVGAAKLVDMGTSINNQIINFSKYFRFGFVAIILMAVFNVIANWLLIPRYEIMGAALATLLSLSLYNVIKLLFIQWRFKMQPFTIKSLWLVLIAAFVFFISLAIPSTDLPLLDIIIRSILIIALYLFAVLYFKISSDFENMLLNLLNKLKNIF